MMITNNHLSASTFSIWSMSHEPPACGQSSKAGRKKWMPVRRLWDNCILLPPALVSLPPPLLCARQTSEITGDRREGKSIFVAFFNEL